MFTRASRPPDAVLAYAFASPHQFLELYTPATPLSPPPPLILLLHGGFWRPEYDCSHVRPLATALAASGYAVVNAEYRRRPGAPDESVKDVVAALSGSLRLVDYALHNGKVLLVGHSAGGHLALLAAHHSPALLAGVLALAPVADLAAAAALGLDNGAVSAFLGERSRDEFDPARLPAPTLPVPVRVVHGSADARVPREVAAAYTHSDFLSLPGVGHFELVDPENERVWPHVRSVVEEMCGTLSRASLCALDELDPLADKRELFSLPDGVLYMDGNSLGALPKATAARVASVVTEEWGKGLIRSWNDAGWIRLAGVVADKIGRLIGAEEGSVMAGDCTSVQLFKALSAALALRPGRRVILSEQGNFPTDLYIAEGLIAQLGNRHYLHTVPAEQLLASLEGEDVAVLMLTHVNFRSGAMHDMEALTNAAHAAGALVVWDLAHSAGAMPLDLAACGVDFAVGCGYKFLNGGPGAPAFIYAAPALQESCGFGITGWLGHAAPFAFEPSFRPAPGVARAVVGTPPILSLAALEVGVDLALTCDMAAVRAKSERMCSLFIALVAQLCPGGTFRASPGPAAARGSQVSLAHPHAYEIVQALIARGVIGDFRTPDVLRFGITPLYLRFADVFDAAKALQVVMQTEEWRVPQFAVRHAVT